MKNIHILPTDKPSRLGYLTKKGKEVFNDLRLFEKPMPNILDSENQHIYITSDEEIKEGDWCYDKVLNLIFQTDNHTDFNYVNQTDNVFKIILTTDQGLDGVQVIDDTFLQWFVNNSSCEFVDVRYEVLKPFQSVDKGYTIHLPDNEVLGEPKQETLEEVAINCWAEGAWDNRDDFTDGFVEGAKWEQERMYSEEEVKFIISEALQSALINVDLEQWFKQFNKKK